MGISIRRNFGPLHEVPFLEKADFEAIGRLVRERIIRRTTAGRDADGAAFAPYSPGYVKARASEGHLTSPVTLQLSGEMLRTITITVPPPTTSPKGVTRYDRVILGWTS